MPHHTNPFNPSTTRMRHKLPTWIRPVFDILDYMASMEGVKEALATLERHEIHRLAVETIVRLDPYKAPEQYALEATMIASYLWDEKLHKPEPMPIEDIVPILNQMEKDERNGN